MILVDANMLLYAKIADFDQNEAARTWLDRSLLGAPPRRLPLALAPHLPAPRHQSAVLAELLRDRSVTGGLVMDAHLAALAVEHGPRPCSTDGDFARFEGLRWENPLRG